ncbi:hypothetical protein ACWD4O_39015 [Streptomyces sp. NPDC002623]
MTELLTALAAGLLAGFTGMLIGRRQVTDGAAVEHDQWLRGQRQEAYVGLLDAWDATVQALEDVVAVWPDRQESLDQGVEGWEVQKAICDDVDAAGGILMKPLDRAALLGPEGVDEAVAAMDAAYDDAATYLKHQAGQDGPDDTERMAWTGLLTQAHRARRDFMAAAKLALLDTPRPGRRLRWPFRT